MDDAAYQKEIDRIKVVRDFWHDHLGCVDWRIAWEYFREPFKDQTGERADYPTAGDNLARAFVGLRDALKAEKE